MGEMPLTCAGMGEYDSEASSGSSSSILGMAAVARPKGMRVRVSGSRRGRCENGRMGQDAGIQRALASGSSDDWVAQASQLLQ